MTIYQSSQNAWMAYKAQSALGSQASGSGGTILRQTGGAGGALTRAATPSTEVKRDGMSTKGRLGTQKAVGTWDTEVSLGNFESILEAIMRDTWDASALVLNSVNFTSVTVSGVNTLTFTSGDPRTLGLRVGDVVRITTSANAANNNKNIRITGLTATTVTTAETLSTQAVDASFVITRPKKLIMGGTPIKRYWTIDEYDQDIDLSEVMTDFMWGMAKFTMAPNGIIHLSVGGAGTGQYAAQTTGTSPLLTSPTEGTNMALSVVDATIRVNGTDVVDLTAFDITMDIKPAAPDVFGSGAIKYSPDVFPGDMEVSMNITALRKDLQRLTDFLAETSYSLQVLMVENTTEPKNFFNLYVGNFTLGSAQKAALAKSGGPRTQTLSIPAALVGKDNTGTGYDASMLKLQSTGI